jgi:hypothetical protein
MADIDISAELMAHERECAVRYEAIERRLARLELMSWGFNLAIISALFAIVMKLV